MPIFKVVEENEAQGKVKEIYDEMERYVRNGPGTC